MNAFLILALIASTTAAPAYENAAIRSGDSYGSYGARSASILQQIHQVNEDGSFTFGYENSDGSFRMENRDPSGYVVGRYGYIDAYGKTQEFDYVSGNLGGVSVGHQVRSNLIPRTSIDTPFPVVRGSTQIARDLEYMSVDANNDGFPDNSVAIRTVEAAPVYNSPSIAIRTVESPSYSAPAVVRAVEAAPAYSPASTTAVRTIDVATPVATIQPEVRLVAEQPTVSVVSNPSVVRLAAETPVQQQFQVLERFVVPQQRQQTAIYQDGQSVFRTPAIGNYGDQNLLVSRTQPTTYGSTSHLDSFLRNLVVGGRSNNGYQQQFQVVGNGLTNLGSTSAVFQDDVLSVDALGRFGRII